ncbi:MAG: hypothetical protein GXP62_05410, partial [Oligoflexia bacterium]|nr:hypothetical protein [Oligoflexia bacterium]
MIPLRQRYNMPFEHLIERSPMKAVATSTRGGLKPGQIGACFARSGVGKTAFIVQIAMYKLLRGTNVLHVSRTDNASHVRSYYDELFSALTTGIRRDDRNEAAVDIERHRIIHSSLDKAFGPEDLRKLSSTLAEVMDFRANTIVIDGMEVDDLRNNVDAWRSLADQLKVRLWITVRTHRDGQVQVEGLAELTDSAVVLVPSGRHVDLHILREGGRAAEETPALALDPVTMLLHPEDVRDKATMPPSPAASACTLYSGGAVGAEAWFGEQAEKWQVAEQNFSFEGHEQARTT